MMCCPPSFRYSSIAPVGVDLFAGGTGTVQGRERDQTCYGSLLPEYAYGDTWTVDDTGVATVSGTGDEADLTGVAPGTATVTGHWEVFTYASEHSIDGPYCEEKRDTTEPAAPTTVRPTVTGISPNKGLIASTVNVTITGTGFGGGTAVNAGSGITVSVSSITSSQIQASFEINATTATGGNHAISVTSNGQTSMSSANFYVQIPTSLLAVIGNLRTHNGGTITDCQGTILVTSAYGYSRLLTYTVMDQSGTTPITQSGMTAAEHVYKISSNPANAGGDFTSSVGVTSLGTFCDVQAFFTTASPAPQNGEYIKLKQVIDITEPGRLDSVRVNCLNQQYNDVYITNTTSNPDASCQ